MRPLIQSCIVPTIPNKINWPEVLLELQAESVAYVVASYYGIDTSDYSFAYLASWSDDKDTLTDLEAQLDIVQQEYQKFNGSHGPTTGAVAPDAGKTNQASVWAEAPKV